MSRLRLAVTCIVALAIFLLFPRVLTPQVRQARQITEKIDNSKRQTLAGNTRSQAIARNDRGRVSDDLAMEHMLLQLQRSTEREEALEQYIEQLHDTSSPNFHKWLTAEELGQNYGLAQEDLDTVTEWLEAQGFTVNTIYPGSMVIDFSGTAGQVRQAFNTEIHNVEVDGEAHVANMSDPQIPTALAPAVAGIVSMHDFRPRGMRIRPNYTFTASGATYQALVPADLATIYNLTPLFTAGITGSGQTIAVVEDTDLYTSADWTKFQSTFGLTQYGGTLKTVHPAPASGTNNCTDPGVLTGSSAGEDLEAILDAEWATAAAPGATIWVAACASTKTTFGGLIALQNMISSSSPPSIVSVSYGECEAENGASANAAYSKAYQSAVALGISVFVAAGDSSAAGCDPSATAATHGIGISGFASTPYNVAVGGTDFADTYKGTASTYWNTSNTSTYGSAKSYIPEIPWNDSCASTLWADYFGYSKTYGSSGFCASSTAKRYGFLTVVGGGGGPSGCATGTPSTTGVVGGTCKGYSKPSWQSGVTGISSDGVRDIPDVSLFAADGGWGHYYVVCWSNTRSGGTACTGAPSGWSGGGGTSFSAPILAGIQALVNQKTSAKQGNPNSVYYKLAASYSCDSESTETSGCIFHRVTLGDIDVNCTGSVNCYGATSSSSTSGRRSPGSNSSVGGVLSTSSSSYLPAYSTSTYQWNFATGLGSVNAYNLVNNWTKGQ